MIDTGHISTFDGSIDNLFFPNLWFPPPNQILLQVIFLHPTEILNIITKIKTNKKTSKNIQQIFFHKSSISLFYIITIIIITMANDFNSLVLKLFGLFHWFVCKKLCYVNCTTYFASAFVLVKNIRLKPIEYS